MNLSPCSRIHSESCIIPDKNVMFLIIPIVKYFLSFYRLGSGSGSQGRNLKTNIPGTLSTLQRNVRGAGVTIRQNNRDALGTA